MKLKSIPSIFVLIIKQGLTFEFRPGLSGLVLIFYCVLNSSGAEVKILFVGNSASDLKIKSGDAEKLSAIAYESVFSASPK